MPLSRAARWSGPLRPADPAALAISDALNAVVPWLWWPLSVPVRDRPLPAPAHALYAVHGTLVWLAVGRRPRAAAAVPLGAVSWLWFTGAWDRRAGSGPTTGRVA